MFFTSKLMISNHTILREYNNNGYLLIKNFFNNEDLDKILKNFESFDYEKLGCDVYFENLNGIKKIKRVEKISSKIKEYNELLQNSKLMDLIALIFNEEGFLFKEKINFKVRLGGSGFGYHIDGHFHWFDNKNNKKKGWFEYASDFLNVVIPLCKADEKNGCLRVCDKYQTEKLLGSSWSKITNNLFNHGPFLKEDIENKIFSKPISMNVGDILIFNWKCIHGSNYNYSNNDRPILYLTYNKKSEGFHLDKYYSDKNNSKNSIKNKSLIKI